MIESESAMPDIPQAAPCALAPHAHNEPLKFCTFIPFIWLASPRYALRKQRLFLIFIGVHAAFCPEFCDCGGRMAPPCRGHSPEATQWHRCLPMGLVLTDVT
jgi:hypothetical protein